MNAKREPAQSPRKTRRKASPLPTVHTCIECPVCGSETCKTLQDLGMYCDTEIAASEAARASRAEAAGNGKSAA